MLSSLLPNIGDLLGSVIDFAQPLITAMWPFLGYLIGIPAAFILLGFLANKIQDIWDWNDEKDELKEIKRGYQEILGARTGEKVFETFRLADNMSVKPLDPMKFILPRDWYAGQTMYEALRPAKIGLSAEDKQFGITAKKFNPYSPNVDLSDFKERNPGLISRLKDRYRKHQAKSAYKKAMESERRDMIADGVHPEDANEMTAVGDMEINLPGVHQQVWKDGQWLNVEKVDKEKNEVHVRQTDGAIQIIPWINKNKK